MESKNVKRTVFETFISLYVLMENNKEEWMLGGLLLSPSY